jgi:predicted metal-dependent enzyme (double-stranded beta helix superfamily)
MLVIVAWALHARYRTLPPFSNSEVQKFYRSSDLTILNVSGAPRMTIMPHNHQIWALIGTLHEPEFRACGTAPRGNRTQPNQAALVSERSRARGASKLVTHVASNAMPAKIR